MTPIFERGSASQVRNAVWGVLAPYAFRNGNLRTVLDIARVDSFCAATHVNAFLRKQSKAKRTVGGMQEIVTVALNLKPRIPGVTPFMNLLEKAVGEYMRAIERVVNQALVTETAWNIRGCSGFSR